MREQFFRGFESLRSCFPKGTLHRIDDGLKVARVLRKRGATGRKQVVGASWPLPNEFLLYSYVAFFLKLLQVGKIVQLLSHSCLFRRVATLAG